MKLPVIIAEIKGQRYECQRCGRGCRELVVHLTGRDRNKIDRQGWGGRLGYEPYVRFGSSLVLNHKPNGDCVFLREDGRCGIHAKFGLAAKPLACQLYPFTLEPDGEVLRVSVRFDCPAIAKSAGSSLGEYRREVGRIAGELRAAAPQELAPPTRPVELAAGRPLSSGELSSLVEHLDRWVGDTSRPIMDRLAGLNCLIDTLGSARLAEVRDDRFEELIGMLVTDLPNVVEGLDEQSTSPPGGRQLKLFRQAIFAHVENIRLEEARAPFFKRLSSRLDQVKRARRLVAGMGSLPRLALGSGGGTFAQLERTGAHPELSVTECDLLLTRYLRARILGRTVFGQGCFGWPVLEGLRALLLAVAVTGWVMRYIALGDGRETYTFDDLAEAIGVVDRNATRSPELGTRSARLRLRYLGRDQGIMRLLRAYWVG